ncbi:MAG: hypothetical protein V3U19_10385 [Thermodesulfobacteriota bacterium]|jgi:hypothetical protein
MLKKQGIAFNLLFLLLFFVFQNNNVLAKEGIYRELVDRGIATYEDGCRAISYFVDVPENTMTFEELVVELKKKGIIGKRWKYKAEKPLTRGIVSYMMCKVLNIKGGFTMRAIDITKRFTGLIRKKLKIKDGIPVPDLGMSKRYAYLECENKGILPIGHNKLYLTGHDVLAVMYRIEQYIKSEERKRKQEEEKKKKKKKV